MLKKLIFLSFFLLILISCSKTFYGKYITTKLPILPKEEFKLDNIVVLGIENPDLDTREEWLFRFLIYKNGKKDSEYFVRSEIVNTRRFYLKEVRQADLKTVAQFESIPTYENAKDRVISLLRSRM